MNTKINGKTNGPQKFGDKENGRTTDIFEDIIIRQRLKIQGPLHYTKATPYIPNYNRLGSSRLERSLHIRDHD